MADQTVLAGRSNAHGSSVLLLVPVDPIQNIVCVLVGFALSTFAARWSRQSA